MKTYTPPPMSPLPGRSGYAYNKAAQFSNSSGELIVCWQLFYKDAQGVVAIADFRAGKLDRFDCSRDYVAAGREWVSHLMAS